MYHIYRGRGRAASHADPRHHLSQYLLEKNRRKTNGKTLSYIYSKYINILCVNKLVCAVVLGAVQFFHSQYWKEGMFKVITFKFFFGMD